MGSRQSYWGGSALFVPLAFLCRQGSKGESTDMIQENATPTKKCRRLSPTVQARQSTVEDTISVLG